MSDKTARATGGTSVRENHPCEERLAPAARSRSFSQPRASPAIVTGCDHAAARRHAPYHAGTDSDRAWCCWSSASSLLCVGPLADAHGLLHHPAEPGARAHPVRRLSRAPCAMRASTGRTRSTPARPARTVDERTGKTDGRVRTKALAARPHLQRRAPEGERQERQPHRDCRCRGMARRRYTAKAIFDVDDYSSYVHTQSETALRHVATTYAYDQMPGEPEGEITLRSNIEEVSAALKEELAVRLEKAGVVIDDARLTHLAYAPEIAQAMLRRQQAEAVIAAREKIVQGAVAHGRHGARRACRAKHVVDLDDERTCRHGVEPHGGALRRVRSPARAEHGDAVPVGKGGRPVRLPGCPQCETWRNANNTRCASTRLSGRPSSAGLRTTCAA